MKLETYDPVKKLNESEIYDIPGLDSVDRSIVGLTISAFNKDRGSREKDLMDAIRILRSKAVQTLNESSENKSRDDILWDVVNSNYYLALARLNEALVLERYYISEGKSNA